MPLKNLCSTPILPDSAHFSASVVVRLTVVHVLAIAVLVAFSMTACRTASTEGLRRTESGITLSPLVHFRPARDGGRGAPQALIAKLVLRNAADTAITTTFSRCLHVKVFSVPADSLIWETSRSATCMVADRRIRLAPGDTASIGTGYSGAVVRSLGGEGTFRFALVAVIDGRRHEVDAGEVVLDVGLKALEFSGTSRLAGARADTLEVRAVATNRSAVPIHVNWGDCALSLALYRNSARTGLPAFDESAPSGRPPSGIPPRFRECLAYGKVGPIAPGSTFSPPEFTWRIAIAEILGDSLAAATYFPTLAVKLNSLETRVDLPPVSLK